MAQLRSRASCVGLHQLPRLTVAPRRADSIPQRQVAQSRCSVAARAVSAQRQSEAAPPRTPPETKRPVLTAEVLPSRPERRLDDRLRRLALFLLVAFLGFALAMNAVPFGAPILEHSVSGGWKTALVVSHTLGLMSVLVSMRVFFEALPQLGLSRNAVFIAQLGSAFVLLAAVAEIGWHASQGWYYQGGYSAMHFMTGFFGLCGQCMWAEGLRTSEREGARRTDGVFAAAVLTASASYAVGATGMRSAIFEAPMYVALSAALGVVALRSYTILRDWRVFLCPVFSIGANFSLMLVLSSYGESAALNAALHLMHDLLGSQAGMLFFAWLFYERISNGRLKP